LFVKAVYDEYVVGPAGLFTFKCMKFFSEVLAEMKKVTWPSKEKTFMYAGIVIFISVFIGYYLGLFDYLFQNYGLKSLL